MTYINGNVGMVAVYREQTYGQISDAYGRISSEGFGISGGRALAHLGDENIQYDIPHENEPSFNPEFEQLAEGRGQPRSTTSEWAWYMKPETIYQNDGTNDLLSYDPCIRAAGFGSDIVPDSGGGPYPAFNGYANYELPSIPGNEESMSWQAWLGNELSYISTGNFAETFEVDFTASGYPRATAAFRGLYQEETAENYPSLGPEGYQGGFWNTQNAPCIIGSAVNTTVEGDDNFDQTIRIASCVVSLTNELAPVETIDAENGIGLFKITGRTVATTLTVYVDPTGGDNTRWTTLWKNGNMVKVLFDIGTNPETIRNSIAGQIMSIERTKVNGLRAFTINIENRWSRSQAAAFGNPWQMVFGNVV